MKLSWVHSISRPVEPSRYESSRAFWASPSSRRHQMKNAWLDVSLWFHQICPWCLSLMSVLDVCPWCLSLMSVLDVCPWCLSLMSVLDVCPWCLSLMFVLARSPQCLCHALSTEVNLRTIWRRQDLSSPLLADSQT